ncbi:Protein of unknown function [Pyronema omphalodes CBS 100304]|uniref:Uncharacterized protein n=1 Tax=Pyronema omphalodes (strain CBS 100304) TaxID=1076935 RepID=U4LJA3_PYROM|nr:Protein of unknown function [Pyronema omphalodes CBS 100304]
MPNQRICGRDRPSSVNFTEFSLVSHVALTMTDHGLKPPKIINKLVKNNNKLSGHTLPSFGTPRQSDTITYHHTSFD